MRYVRGFGRFWYDFVIGDDSRIAVGVAAVLAAGAVLVVVGMSDELLAPLTAAGIIVVVTASVLSGARR